MINTVNDILQNFKPVNLSDMDNVALQNRIDTKYVLHVKHLTRLLEQLKETYQVLEIKNKRCFIYNTIYYDTPNSEMFYTHLRGKLNRYKVRKRTYESGDSFIEVKFKNNKLRTIKWRTNILNGEINEEFLSKHIPYNPKQLVPIIENSFNRLTLVDKNFTHRATLDFGLTFNNYVSTNGSHYQFDNLAIVELKTNRSEKQNDISYTLKQMGVFPNGFSKYCMGRVYTEEDINKFNNVKPRVLHINKITECY